MGYYLVYVCNMKKCKVCSEKFKPTFSSLQPTCTKPECLAAWGKREYAKQKLKEDKTWKKEASDRLMTSSDHLALLQKLINRITAIIDGDMNCISCNAPITPMNMANAGHRFSVNAHRHIRFNLHNIHRQGVCCNKWKSGNPDGYDEGLGRIYGVDYAGYVKSLKHDQYDLRLTIPEITDACKKSREFIKHINAIEDKSKVRIELRNLGNERIGIYK